MANFPCFVSIIVYLLLYASSDISNPQQWKTYLFRLVHNAAVSILRHHTAQQNYLREQDAIEEDFMHNLIQQETLDRLFTAIDALPERYRRLFNLSFSEGLRNKEIAQLLDVSVRAVVKQKARLIQLIRQGISSILLFF